MLEKRESIETGPQFRRRTWILIALAAVVVAVAWLAGAVLLLVFAGVLAAMVIRGLGRLIAKISSGRIGEKAAVGIAIGLLVALGVGAGWLTGHEIAKQVDALFATFPAKLERVREQLTQSALGRQALHASDAEAWAGRAPRLFSTTLGALGDLLVVVFLGIYFALDGPRYRDGLLALVPAEHRPRAASVSDDVAHALHGWMVGQLVAMAIIGVSVTILLLVLDLPMALVLGVMAGLLNFVPYIGPLVAIVPATIFALAESPTKAAWLLGCYFVIQIAESYVITPAIQKRTVNMPPPLLIVSELLFGLWAGVLGIVLASPLAVVALVLVRELWIAKRPAPAYR